ncbi:myocardin-related transcription factor B isoform X2 [Cottoperca gobio]|uniref:Myocardin-related transcription factor B-like isoform X2 n=1 Tax=Cottoperca gobio TaxID=56716 RepID=A0A6J2Q5M4_COTGO|nr:myocardin-related transcription factor B-like isoform X2 [Cottoperca gobio]XP_029292653.1 myocardin-related transcription factor B-like isoform X2 [Cottoperca gobio]XP_029292654.1 myocardin-related transcription factor B-like isoform X2 [Cottoperca gobio]
MGLQTWPPSKPPLSSMACLDVETPSICRVLQLCLQQRRTREQLVEQGIMPPLKTPAAFHEQIRSLERARTGSFLKHKLCSRPERSELVRMHILQETQAEACLQATQMKLKRARLADDLNEKLSQRPGPMELVEKNILPVDSGVEEDIDDAGPTGGEVNDSKPTDVYNFDEDSGDALSPQQPAVQKSPGSTSASPRGSAGTEATSTSSDLNSPIQRSPPPNSQSSSNVVSLVSTGELQNIQQASAPQPIAAVVPSVTPGPLLVKQSLPRLPGDKSRGKKSKEPKPRVKKLKYHQYIPPDQKQELNEVLMDSAYARLLEQQQQFLQLQILNQQQQQFSYQAVLPATLKPTTEVQTSCSSAALSGNAASTPVQPWHTQTNRRPDHLPVHLEEMKVAELKMELKLRSLPVSGTKTDLIERLKLYQENSKTAAAIETTASQSDNIKLTPPVSPIASKVSSLGIEDSPTKPPDAPCVNSPRTAPQEECPTRTRPYAKDSEKDKRLHEKERQIEELMRKLEQEQRLVEELKMQLEVEKRSQQGDSPPQLSPLAPLQVKEENGSLSNCSASCASPGLTVLVKQEEVAPQTQFIISQQTIKQPVQAGAQILLPACRPASALTIQLPASSIKLHTTVSGAAPGLIQTSGQVPQKTKASAALQQCSTQPPTETWRMGTAQSLLDTFPASGSPVGASPSPAAPKDPTNKPPCTSRPTLLLPKFTNHVSKCKDPPRYEDAVKQTRSMLTAVQGPTAASQQMDDLFDVLIESGEISPFIRQDPPSLDKPLPVTASVTTLPINTVLSRPPPLIQVAQLPAEQLDPSASLALTSDTQLETLLGAHTEPQTLKLLEELHSPVVSMEVDSPSALNLHSTNMDNMDWLDLTLSVPAEGVNPLDMSAPAGVFSSDFLDSHELHLNWE